MIQEGSQALLTFTGRSNPTATVVVDENGVSHHVSNSSSKKDIKKIMAFPGAINPENGKFEKVLNVDWYIANHKPFPKKYCWSKKPYVEQTQNVFHRKTRWTWEQIQSLLETPCDCSAKQWEKYSPEEKLQAHAEQCKLPGEMSVEVSIVL